MYIQRYIYTQIYWGCLPVAPAYFTMCVRVCVCVCVCVYLAHPPRVPRVYVHVCVYTYVCACVYVYTWNILLVYHICARVRAHMCARVCVRAHVFVFMWVCASTGRIRLICHILRHLVAIFQNPVPAFATLSHELCGMSHQVIVMRHESWGMSHESLVMSHESWVTTSWVLSPESWVMSYEFWVMSHQDLSHVTAMSRVHQVGGHLKGTPWNENHLLESSTRHCYPESWVMSHIQCVSHVTRTSSRQAP